MVQVKFLSKYFNRRKIVWIALGLLALLLSSLLPAGFVEKYYSRGLFLGVRQLFTALNSWLPIASVYLLFFGLLAWLIYRSIHFFKRKNKWGERLGQLLTSLLAFAGGVVFFFQFLWGFNYNRESLESGLGIETKPLSIDELRAELDAATLDVHNSRKLLSTPEDSLTPTRLAPADLENLVRRELTSLLNRRGYPTPGKVRARRLWPKGLLLRISTAGVYIPFTGEGNVDAGLHFLQLPFVMAHEMSHAYGFGDEGTCNFLVYLSCVQSGDLFLNYVGYLYYWRYVAGEYRSAQPDAYKEFWQNLPDGLKADLQAIREEMDKYPDIFPDFRDATYNAYLRAQGIQEGMKNYDRVVMLVQAWRRKKG